MRGRAPPSTARTILACRTDTAPASDLIFHYSTLADAPDGKLIATVESFGFISFE